MSNNSKTPNYDAKVKVILDATKSGQRVCALTGEKWMMTDEEIGWYKKFNVPPSKVSPQARWYHHGFWYVGYQFWYQRHPQTGKPFICTAHPATGSKSLPDAEWFAMDFINIGREYHPAQPFFPQWRELQTSVPSPASRNHIEPKNSIVFVSQGDEDSFFVGASRSKRCLYSHICMDIEDSAELYLCDRTQNSFNVVRSDKIFNGKFIRESRECLNSAFLFDCRNCEYCFFATNKRNKKYLWKNEQLSQGEWERRWSEVDFSSRKNLDAFVVAFRAFIKDQSVWPENFNDHCENSTGEYLTKCTNVKDSYGCSGGSSDQYYCNLNMGDSRGHAFSGYQLWASDMYYCASNSGANCKFCFLTMRSNALEYCLLCYDCEYCFGCVGLRHKKFCIFNKEYSEDEYWKRVDELKCAMLERGEYGEFFPAAYSPSYYKDAGSIPWFGASEQDAEALGCLKFNPESEGAIGQDLSDATKLRKVKDLPDRIDDVTDEWVNVPLLDTQVNRRFAIIKPEIDFYRRMRIAPPAKHFISRIKDLYAEANQGFFIDAFCAKCQKTLRVGRNVAHSMRTIYCRPCYLEYLEKNG